MSLSDRARDALEDLGLTKTEIKAYVALLERGTMTASEVSAAARIPYSKVYQALETLSQKGWLDVQRRRPILYTAKPPEAAMEELRSRQDAERREREQLAVQELLGVYAKRGPQERPDIWILRGDQEIVSKVKNTVLDSNEELLIALPVVLAPFVKQISALLAASKEKGVKCSILTSAPASSDDLRVLSDVAEVRTRDSMFGGGVVADAKEVVLLLGPGDSSGSPMAIWAHHPGLATFAREYFQFLWLAADSAKKR